MARLRADMPGTFRGEMTQDGHRPRPHRHHAGKPLRRSRHAGPAVRHPGAGARPAGTGPAGPRRRAEHRRPGLGLSRLAAGWAGPGGLAPPGAAAAAQNIRFQPGVNEDLAATMLYGTQQLDAFPGKRVDGVFGMWYGKGPGVDRAGDALHCGNFIGTSAHGGVLAVSGDDHGAHSSTYPHQTEHVFQGVFIPVLNPASVAGHHRPRPGRHRVVALLRTLGCAEDHRRDRRAGGHADRSRPPAASSRRTSCCRRMG